MGWLFTVYWFSFFSYLLIHLCNTLTKYFDIMRSAPSVVALLRLPFAPLPVLSDGLTHKAQTFPNFITALLASHSLSLLRFYNSIAARVSPRRAGRSLKIMYSRRHVSWSTTTKFPPIRFASPSTIARIFTKSRQFPKPVINY